MEISTNKRPDVGQVKPVRQQNFEVLRVLSMLFIVVGHYIYWGINNNPKSHEISNILDWSFLEIIRIITLTAVDVYVFISGYFLIERTDFRMKGILRTWFTTLFYSVTIYAIVCLLDYQSFSLKGVFEATCPITSAKYWFIQKYLGLMLMAPFLSRLALQLDKKMYLVLLLVLFLLNFNIPGREPFNEGNVCSLSWFVFLYFAAGYYKLHGIPCIIEKHVFKLNVLFTLAFFLGVLLVNYWRFGSGIENYKLLGTGPDGVIVFLAMLLFLYFAKLRCNNRIMSIVAHMAPYTLGVYLIHENRNITTWLWHDLMPSTYLNSLPLSLHCLLFSFLLFIVCVLIDYLRFSIFRINSPLTSW